ncbi:NAD(P)H-dependent oxidoreductase [Kocuria sp. M1R5S2]|uniref:NAD(P)H-dependent oxidoreductase n=1 Tax=Kocuria rhizosphaerae TaxID=3376285 RepID=UPI0037BAE935
MSLLLKTKLDARAAQDTPIRVGFVGSGRMGTGAICQIGKMVGIEVTAIADVNTDRAVEAFEKSEVDAQRVSVCDDAEEARRLIEDGQRIATSDWRLLLDIGVDVVVESTGIPEVGADVAMQAILNHTHVVMLNVETDVAVGPILSSMADRSGVVYTVASGDEPGLIAELYDRYTSLGFTVVATGKSPSSIGEYDRYATPDSVREDAERLKINPHFLVTFRDATKTMIEMAAVSNYTGLRADVRGMHGPVAGVEEISRFFRPKAEGGQLNGTGVIDYARPLKNEDGSIDFFRSVTPGVFMVIHTDNQQIRDDLDYLDVYGDNGYYVMHTPYHLVTNELPLSIVQAVDYGQPTIYPKKGLVTEVFAAAKKSMKAGDVIDGAGGAAVYSLVDDYETCKKENIVPLALLTNAKLTRDVDQDEVITYDMVDLNEESALYHLRRLQESMETV